MRNLMTGLMLGAAALSLMSCGEKEETAKTGTAATAGGTPMPIPKRKAGLWEQTVALAGGMAPMVISLCIDEATDAQLSAFGDQVDKTTCPDSQIIRGADGSWSFSSTCNRGTGGVVRTEGKATGDFNSNYRVDANITTTGAALEQMNRPAKMTMTAKWVGACPADMAPGMMTMPGGVSLDVTKLRAAQDASPK